MAKENLIRTNVINLKDNIGKRVLIKGWVSQWRELKKFSFLIHVFPPIENMNA